jgi:hypothetical protein
MVSDTISVMDERFWIAVLIIAGFACYVAAKVIGYMRKSEREWKQVDKSKLKTWDDDEDW